MFYFSFLFYTIIDEYVPLLSDPPPCLTPRHNHHHQNNRKVKPTNELPRQEFATKTDNQQRTSLCWRLREFVTLFCTPFCLCGFLFETPSRWRFTIIIIYKLQLLYCKPKLQRNRSLKRSLTPKYEWNDLIRIVADKLLSLIIIRRDS